MNVFVMQQIVNDKVVQELDDTVASTEAGAVQNLSGITGLSSETLARLGYRAKRYATAEPPPEVKAKGKAKAAAPEVGYAAAEGAGAKG